MSRATGTAASGADAGRRGAGASKGTASKGDGARGSAADGADSPSGGDATTANRGDTMTETRGPKPYHPPKAYEPPAERTAAGGTKSGAKGRVPRPATGGKSTPAAAAATPAAPAAPAAAAAPRTRSARLRVAKADPWSVMKVSFLLSLALGICTIVAITVLWLVLDAMGVFSAVGGTISDATSGEGGGFDLQSFLSLPRVLMFTTIIAVIEVVLATALATLVAFVYNLSASFVGGVELTLAEDE
ncbi:DUF3566 domain-containing protein [Streptomyces sp. AV19]|uniref:DUF3566 domain-containing protein n=1 Tax=Streptomyces sp. AV19 TaxID=2793068 RepID=UPI0024131B47|nr:DUF3566 domain-containing protein [Streptomyces sp. AV19]MDG4530734.1 DUF3566 domain-containing protein [Streptomyces sp. AV19]